MTPPYLFTRRHGSWYTKGSLPAWAGFQSRQGPYASQNSEQPSSGQVALVILRDDENDESPVSDAEQACVHWAFEQAEAMALALLQALQIEYTQLRPRYEKFLADSFNELMPEISGVNDFRSLIGLNTLYIYPPQPDNIPYVGFLFGCTWEQEHGLGVVMHGTQVVEIGGADEAFCFYPPSSPVSTP